MGNDVRYPLTAILCRVVEFSEQPEAVCEMIVDGYEIPRVSFPADLLRQKGLQVGDRFSWLPANPDNVESYDIDTDVPPETTVDLERLEALHAEMMKGLAEDGGNWPEYTGDGR